MSMRKVSTVTICGQAFDFAIGTKRKPISPCGPKPECAELPHAALAREGEDLYGRPMAVEADLESELACVGNVAFVEDLLLLLATTIQERDAALAAARRAEP